MRVIPPLSRLFFRCRRFAGCARIPRYCMAVALLQGSLCVNPAWAATHPDDPSLSGHDAVETIIMIRHGEKPSAGLGQLDCRGLNRALALPSVIAARFGAPDYVFAPDPTSLKIDAGRRYHYIRPLMTVEPTAIRFHLPVDTSFGYQQYQRLGEALDAPQYRNATILVGWEHRMVPPLARQLLAAHGGDPKQVPDWRWDNFDGIYVVRIVRRAHGPVTAQFSAEAQHLDGQPDTCPGPPVQLPAAGTRAAPN